MPKVKSNKSSEESRPVAACRNWLLTLNNPVKDVHYEASGRLRLPEQPGNGTDIRAYKWQLEMGDTTHTKHIQGFFQLRVAKKLKAVKALLGVLGNAHLEPVTVTPEKAKEYCGKEETRLEGPYEFGNFIFQGDRTELDALRATLLAGGIKMAWEKPEHFSDMLKYSRGAEKFVQAMVKQPHRTGKRVLCLVGAPGAGKSALARCIANEVLNKEESTYYKSNADMWWDGYTNQEIIIWDDFQGAGYNIQAAKQLLDVTPYSAQFKGGMVPLADKLIIITSNSHPSTWWAAAQPQPTEADKVAILRRMTVVEIQDGSAESRTTAWEEAMKVVTAVYPGTYTPVLDSYLSLPWDAALYDHLRAQATFSPTTVPLFPPPPANSYAAQSITAGNSSTSHPAPADGQLGLWNILGLSQPLPDLTMGGFFPA